jgi:Carboxypeptidase regulatory-like domain
MQVRTGKSEVEISSRGSIAAWVSRAVAFCAVLFLFSLSAHAQYRGSLRGTVTDQQGAIVPGATVTLTDTATSEQKVSIAGEDGLYTFTGLSSAQFTLSTEKTGFKKKLLSEVKIIPDQLNELNIQLEVGDVQQTVTVSGQTQALDSETATVSSTISSNQIQHLPSFNRDVFQLAQLTPGVFGDGSQAGGGGSFNLPGNQGPGGTGGGSGGIFQTENGPQIQTRGGQYETNSVTVDGISTVSAVWGGTSIITPSEDSVDNLKVVSNSYDAENGRFSGAQIQVTSKSGSNEIHGSAFFKASRPGLNAYQRWNGAGSYNPGTPSDRGLNRDSNQFNQYGGSLGGPIWKDKIFAFFNWETSPLSSTTPAQGWYETSAFDSGAATGSIAAKYLSYPGEAVSAKGIIQRTCQSIGLNEGVNCNTTASGLDVGSPLKTGVGLQDLSYGGSNTSPGLGGGLDGVADLAYYTSVNPTTTSQMQYNGRLDAAATQRDHLSFTIYWVPLSTTDYNGPIRSANLWHHSQTNDAFAVIWNHTFSPSLLNEARANAAGWRWDEVGSNPQEPFGLPQDNIDDIGTIGGDGGFQYFGAPGPSNLNQWTYSYNDVLTKVAGRHNIKIGGELSRLYYLNNPVYAARPAFNFHNLWDFANDAPYYESGQFNSATGVPFANRQDDRVNIWGFFAQDDFKVLPNLTINLGLRWSYFGAFYSKENNLDVLRLGTGADPLDGINIRVGGSLYDPQKANFGPQFGFAYQPTMFQNKMVVRGGFGVNYNQNEIAITANGNGNPPNAVSANYTCPYPFTDNPSCAGNGILYQTAGDIHSIFGYAPNPATITAFGANNLPLTGATRVTGFPAKPKTISNYHFSLDVQYQLPANTVATVQYQGSLSRHVLIQNDQNSIAAANGEALNPAVSFVDYYDNAGTGNFHSGIASLNHIFAHGFQAEALYTWAKSMDENSGPYSEDFYPYNTHAAYGRSDYNVQNAFKIFGLWQPTLFHGDHGWLEKAAGGWSLSGIWNVHTGFPWSPVYNTVSNLYYQGSGYSQLRPASSLHGFGTSTDNSAYKQVAVNPNFSGDGTKYFLPPTYVAGAAFPAASPAPAPGIFRNSLNSPGYNGLDASLTKAFGLPNMKILGENAKFEIRADTYNLLNKTNINATSIDTTLGTVNPNGTLVNPDGSSSINSHFGVAGSALASRTVQLQARFSF